MLDQAAYLHFYSLMHQVEWMQVLEWLMSVKLTMEIKSSTRLSGICVVRENEAYDQVLSDPVFLEHAHKGKHCSQPIDPSVWSPCFLKTAANRQ